MAIAKVQQYIYRGSRINLKEIAANKCMFYIYTCTYMVAIYMISVLAEFSSAKLSGGVPSHSLMEAQIP